MVAIRARVPTTFVGREDAFQKLRVGHTTYNQFAVFYCFPMACGEVI
jgi:hypothetical protein